MIIPPIRQIGQRHGIHARQHASDTPFVTVEPVEHGHAPRERRSAETLANANALRLGIAAQMMASFGQQAGQATLPTHPAMRMAARYASTAEGAAPLSSLGFSRTL